MWMGRAEGGDHPGQGGVGAGAGAHVQRRGGQPGRINANHRSNSRRSIWEHSAAADTGQSTLTDMPGRWHSMRMSFAGVDGAPGRCSRADADGAMPISMGTNAEV